MAARAFVTLLFILSSGIVHADVVTPLPSTAETRTNQYKQATVMLSTSSPATSSQSLTTPQQGNTTILTTQLPTTTHGNTTHLTTDAPATTNFTTAPLTTTYSNTTNSTTEVPSTTHIVTTAPTPPPVPNPTVGNYSLKSDNASVCLLAKMGLQFSFKITGNPKFQTLNLDPSPNVTEASGKCGSDGNDASLTLKSKEMTVHFLFTNVSQKFHLHALNFSVELGNGSVFTDSNSNLSLWEASVGSSYMCRKEQGYNITDKLILNTFGLQVQPFGVRQNTFSTAHECSMDDTSLLIPIIVGAALAGLIFIVVIAYVIGRRRTYVGYQTL